MPHSFKDFPSDVILHNILPFLDYDSRQTMNRLLPPYERLIHRIPLNDRIQHDVYTHMSISRNVIDRLAYTHNRTKRVGIWRNYCKELLSHKLTTILQYCPNFQETVKFQLYNWSDEAVLIRYNIPSWLQKRVQHLTKQVLLRLDNLPSMNPIGKPRAYLVA